MRTFALLRLIAAAALALLAPQLQAGTARLERSDLEAWLDGMLPVAMERGDIAGAVVVVVKDGEVLLQKGYGYADVEQRIAVDPERTLMRAGSVGKLFTWTAVMQLVEQGKIELDRDVNAYLDFEIPARFGKPITMRHLMTHMGGFEEQVRAFLHSRPQSLQTLEHYVKSALPARIFPPGEIPGYSNYGVALAGYIVQRVSGEPFDDYLDRHIFGPLGMRHSTFRQPLPASLGADMSKGYRDASGAPLYYELVGPAPAGSLAATGADMARFMLAHIEADRGVAGGILSPQGARLMHDSITRAMAPLDGHALGFVESRYNGRRIIGHDGVTQVFHADLQLLPDEGVGVYIVMNSAGRLGATSQILAVFFERFVDRYFPAPAPQEPTLVSALEHGKLIVAAGPYQMTRRSQTTFMAFPHLFGQNRVQLNPDGTLSLSSLTDIGDQPRYWREVAPYVWREVGGKARLAARVAGAKVIGLSVEPYASNVILQPAPWFRSATWNLPLLLGAFFTLLLTTVAWPMVVILRKRVASGGERPAAEARVWTWARFAAAVDLGLLIGWLAVLQAGQSDIANFGESLDPWLRVLQILGVLSFAGAAIAVWSVWLTWRAGRSVWARAWSFALAAACLAVVWIVLAFNLLIIGPTY